MQSIKVDMMVEGKEGEKMFFGGIKMFSSNQETNKLSWFTVSISGVSRWLSLNQTMSLGWK